MASSSATLRSNNSVDIQSIIRSATRTRDPTRNNYGHHLKTRMFDDLQNSHRKLQASLQEDTIWSIYTRFKENYQGTQTNLPNILPSFRTLRTYDQLTPQSTNKVTNDLWTLTQDYIQAHLQDINAPNPPHRTLGSLVDTIDKWRDLSPFLFPDDNDNDNTIKEHRSKALSAAYLSHPSIGAGRRTRASTLLRDITGSRGQSKDDPTENWGVVDKLDIAATVLEILKRWWRYGMIGRDSMMSRIKTENVSRWYGK